MKIAIVASNFSGNVGDLYILRSIVDFISQNIPAAQLDVFPYPIRFNRRVACAEQINLPTSVNIRPHRFAIHGFLDHWCRRYHFLEKFVAMTYFSKFGKFFRSINLPLKTQDYDAIVSAGGEMDTPYSFFDIHDYIKNITNNSKKIIVYGPISLAYKPVYLTFLRKVFPDVEKIGVRDPNTLKYLAGHGFKNTELVPDCAFLSWRGPSNNRLARKRLGLCFHASWMGRFEHACRIVEQTMSAAANLDDQLIIYSTHTHEDYQLLRDLVKKYNDKDGVTFVFPNTSSDFINLSQSLDLVISDRLHALLVGMLHGANILPIKTRDKVIGYCEYLSLENTISLDDGDFMLFSSILKSAKDTRLSEKLAEFCNISHKQVSDFYLTQLSAAIGLKRAK